jgi:UDP-3-O-[3-hydroxymyristoyl] glucosamine N-acyltransferase
MAACLDTPVTAQTLAQMLGLELAGQAQQPVRRLASLESADTDSISFLASRKHLPMAQASPAGVLIVAPDLADQCGPQCLARLLSPDPYADYARLSAWFAAQLKPARDPAGVHPGAWVHPQAVLGEGVSVGPGAVIGRAARIGNHCQIGPGCSIGEGASLGARGVLHAGVVLYPGVSLGERAIIHAGTVIGADGFGFAPSSGGWIKIEQLGSVSIGHEVEIGANCTIDRGALDDTVIGRGVKIDNQVQIGHNVRIGDHTVIAGCVGIAGSAVIGARCMIGGGVGIAGHLRICDGAVIGGFSLVERSVTEPGFYTGAWPLQGHAEWERTAATLKQLPRLRQRLRALETQDLSRNKDPSA